MFNDYVIINLDLIKKGDIMENKDLIDTLNSLKNRVIDIGRSL